MMTTAGFYKLDELVGLLYAPQAVYAPTFTLRAETHAEHSYPSDGWIWADSQEQAEAVLAINGRSQAEWVAFGSTVTRLPEINALLTTALSAGASALAFALAVGLGKAADGRPEVFLDAWAGVKTAGLVPAELTPPLQALAVQHHLPQAFVEALGEP